jgi:hypothetical protein
MGVPQMLEKLVAHACAPLSPPPIPNEEYPAMRDHFWLKLIDDHVTAELSTISDRLLGGDDTGDDITEDVDPSVVAVTCSILDRVEVYSITYALKLAN